MDGPSRYLEIVYTDSFLATAKGVLDQADLRELELQLIERPERGTIMQATGGVRKMRFALPGRGKSGGARVIYILRECAREDLPDRRVQEGCEGQLDEGGAERTPGACTNLQAGEIGAMATTSFGAQLIEGMREAVEIEQGRKEAPRRARYKITARGAEAANVAPPPQYEANDVREIRTRVGMSQAVFALAIGRSSDTVKAWEQGLRHPDGSSRRLLELAYRFPREFLAMVGVDVDGWAEVKPGGVAIVDTQRSKRR